MLTPAQLQQYRTDGFVIVPLFTKQELQPLIDEITGMVDDLAEKLHQHGKIKDKFANEGFATRLTKLDSACPGAAVWFHVQGKLKPELAKVWSHPKLLDIVEQFIGADIAGHPVWNIRSKTPLNPLATVPWHQDTAYLLEGAEQTPQPTAWIPLADVTTKNGTLQVIRGGHAVGQTLRHYPQRDTGLAKSWYLYIKDADLPPGERVTCEMPLGSVLFINQLIPHRSTENLSDQIRWSVDLRWQRPGDPSGVAANQCIPMRSRADRAFQVDWSNLDQAGRKDVEKDARADEFKMEVSVAGPWLTRWTQSPS